MVGADKIIGVDTTDDKAEWGRRFGMTEFVSSSKTEADIVAHLLALRAVIAPFVETPGALLPVLHAVQAAFGYIDDAAVVVIADQLNLSRADVHGVLTFYHDFRRKPAGKTVLKICRAEACQAMGADALIAHAERRLETPMHSARQDNAISLEPVYCLGLCSAAPSAMLDGQVFARLSPGRLDALLAKAMA